MHRIFRIWAFACLATLMALGAPRLSAAEETAQQFLEKLYANYTGKAKGIDYTSSANVKRYMTPELGALFNKKMKADAKRDGPPDLEGDPYVSAQEWVVTELKITVADKGPNEATGTVSFKNEGEPKTITLDLKKTKAGWRIDDIHWPGDEGSLRKLLAGGA